LRALLKEVLLGQSAPKVKSQDRVDSFEEEEDFLADEESAEDL